MKKILFLASLAAVAMTSCTSESNEYVGGNDNTPKEISFNPISQVATRAAGTAASYAVDGVDYPQNYNMKVVAYSVVDGSHKGDYFGTTAGQSFTYQPRSYSNGWWAGETAKYWPLAPATLNFVAVSNQGATAVNDATITPTFCDNESKNWASKVSVVLANNTPKTSATIGAQHDLMYGLGSAAVTQTGNALTYGTNGSVDVTFKHALARVNFRVKGASAAETGIKVKSIKLNNAYYGGTFVANVDNYNVTSPALAWNTTQWSAIGAVPSNSYAVPNVAYDAQSTGASVNDCVVLAETFKPFGVGLMVVPTGSMASPVVSFANFTITYELNGNEYDFTYTPTDAEKTLLLGKKYFFDITFKLQEIFVNASVTNWEDGGDVYVQIPPITYVENGSADVKIPAAAGTYTVTVKNLAAADYTVAKGTGTGDFITVNSPTVATAVAADGDLTITFTVTSNTGKNQPIEIKVSDTLKFTILVTQD